MLILNRRNTAYIKGKRKHPAVDLEGYDNLAKQIDGTVIVSSDDPKIPDNYHSSNPIVDLMWVIFLHLFFALGMLGASIGIFTNLISSLLYHSPKASNVIFEMLGVALPFLFSMLLFRNLWFIFVSVKTKVNLPVMKELIEKGSLLSGHIESFHVAPGHRSKINIEYTFTSPNNETLRGVFTTSKIKAAASGDEVAVWYIKKSLHILL